MKLLVVFLLVATAYALVSNVIAAPGGPWPTTDPLNQKNWTKFDPMTDEFDGNGLNKSKWYDHYPGWEGRQPSWFDPSNIAVSNSFLTITMRHASPPNEPSGYHDYTSGCVTSTAGTAYGNFEIRAKPMNSSGSSAYWFSLPNGAQNGWQTEIDVFEMGAGAKNYVSLYNMNLHVFSSTDQTNCPNGDKKNWHTDWTAPYKFADDFHIYSVEWDTDKIVWSVDGTERRSSPNSCFHQPLHLNFDSESFADWFGLPPFDTLPSTFYIDYVRAWKMP